MPSVVSVLGYSNIPRDTATVTPVINNFLQSPVCFLWTMLTLSAIAKLHWTLLLLPVFRIPSISIEAVFFVQKPCSIWCGSEKEELSPLRTWFFHLSPKVLFTVPVTYRGLVKNLFPFYLLALLSSNLDVGCTQFWRTITELHPCDVRHCWWISLPVWISLP